MPGMQNILNPSDMDPETLKKKMANIGISKDMNTAIMGNTQNSLAGLAQGGQVGGPVNPGLIGQYMAAMKAKRGY
jgi:hypothetical protein